MKDALIEEIAGAWEVQAEMRNDINRGERAMLRSCADLLRTMVASPVNQRREAALSQDAEQAKVYRWMCENWALELSKHFPINVPWIDAKDHIDAAIREAMKEGRMPP